MIPRMTPTLWIHLLPGSVDPDRLGGSVAVMIDVLRASTTLTHALAAGCHSIRTCSDVDTARHLASQPLPHDAPHDAPHDSPQRQPPLLAGERGGTRIDGFDLDNSPSRFTPESVAGRTIVFTTTNGTRALESCRPAELVLVAAFCNMQAVIKTLLQLGQEVHLVCAGTDGQVTAEDCLCAGAIGLALRQQAGIDTHACDATRIAIGLYQHLDQHLEQNPDGLLEAIRDSHGGRNLRQLGLDNDIALAARRDTLDLIPTFNSHDNTISVLA